MKPSTAFLSNSIERLIKKPIRSSIRILWGRNHKNWLIILAYHRVADTYNPQIHLPFGWNQTDDFDRQIRYLTSTYKVVKLFDALEQLQQGTLSGQCIAITIDDGDSSVKSHIAPILKKHNCPATIFITSSYLDCRTLHFPFVVRYLSNSSDKTLKKQITDELKVLSQQLRTTDDAKKYDEERIQIEGLSEMIPDKQQFFLTIDDLQSLNPKIFDIGIHGDEHQRFSMMSAEWQNTALIKNINALKNLETYKPIFALPFGGEQDWNNDTVKACIDNNLYFLTCTGGINFNKSLEYRRIFSDNRSLDQLISRTMTGIL